MDFIKIYLKYHWFYKQMRHGVGSEWKVLKCQNVKMLKLLKSTECAKNWERCKKCKNSGGVESEKVEKCIRIPRALISNA